MTTSNKCQGTVHTTQCATVPPSAELQTLIDKANDKRSIWTKTGDFFSGAWEGTKRVAEASWNDPGNTGIGVAKGVGNLPTDVWNLLVLGSKYSGPIPQALQADALNHGALQAYRGGDTATANALAARASQMMQAGYASDIFELKGDAQKGGSVLSMLVPVGAIAKGAGTAAKVARGGKALDTAADVAKVGKAADGAADVAKVGQEAGNGVVVKAKQSKADQVAANKKKGDDFANKETESFKKDADKVEKEITIKSEDGTKTRVDAIGVDKETGSIRIQEYKGSDSAPLTVNQKDAFPQIGQTGGEVVGKGKGAFPGGTKIPPTIIEIVRPPK